jgi:hypothetical protein
VLKLESFDESLVVANGPARHGINLNSQLSLYRLATPIIVLASWTQWAKFPRSGSHLSLEQSPPISAEAYAVSITDRPCNPEHDLFDRRSEERTVVNRGALVSFAGRPGAHACCVRDTSDVGAGIRLDGLKIVPSEFAISYDGFRSSRRCRLIWRDGDFAGVTFET